MLLTQELNQLTEAFDAAKVEYALCGGLAMAVHGHARATEDIDLLIREESLPAAIQASAVCGFTFESGWLKFRSGTPSEQKMFRLLKPLGDTHLMLDLLVVTPAFESVWQERQNFKRDGKSLSVVSIDGLIEMKSLSGRNRDLSDIERLRGDDHEA